MSTSNLNGPRGLSDAIDRLEEATHNKSKEIKEILGKDYTDLRKALDDLKPHLSELTDKVNDHVSKAKKEVEAKVQESPWTSLAVVGLVGLFLGWILGFGRSRD